MPQDLPPAGGYEPVQYRVRQPFSHTHSLPRLSPIPTPFPDKSPPAQNTRRTPPSLHTFHLLTQQLQYVIPCH